MKKRLITAALAASAVVGFGLGAHAVGVPTPLSASNASHHRGADDPATHDVNDDRGNDTTTSTTVATPVVDNTGPSANSGPSQNRESSQNSGPSANSGRSVAATTR